MVTVTDFAVLIYCTTPIYDQSTDAIIGHQRQIEESVSTWEEAIAYVDKNVDWDCSYDLTYMLWIGDLEVMERKVSWTDLYSVHDDRNLGCGSTFSDHCEGKCDTPLECYSNDGSVF
jgi:hypothetical protein